MALDLAGGEAPDRLQPTDVVASDLIQRAVTPAVKGTAEHQPIAILRFFQSLGGDRRVVLKNIRHWSRRRRCRDRPYSLLCGGLWHACP